jgi:hypothetical protein
VNYTNSGYYTATNNPYPVLEAASPITLVPLATSSPAIMLFGAKSDPVPYQQANKMYTALTTQFGNPPGKFMEYAPFNDTDLHAFDYWHTYNTEASDCVSHQVIHFLQTHP